LDRFDRIARAVEQAAGSAYATAAAVLVVVAWAATGPVFGWSDTWQLVINTGTTIVTFLMVFLIQSTQSRDTRALHLKVDELIRVTGPARNRLILAEEAGQADLDAMRSELQERLRLLLLMISLTKLSRTPAAAAKLAVECPSAAMRRRISSGNPTVGFIPQLDRLRHGFNFLCTN